jgi:hypothetical protein
MLGPVADEAIARWRAAGVSADRLQVLRDVRLGVQDMPSPYLGLTVGDQVWLSRDAAGYGWFTNPGDDEAFAAGRVRGMDLLTAVEHEFGHVLGLEDSDGTSAMAETLPPGTRRTPLLPGETQGANGPGANAPAAQEAGALEASRGATAAALVQPAAVPDPLAHFAWLWRGKPERLNSSAHVGRRTHNTAGQGLGEGHDASHTQAYIPKGPALLRRPATNHESRRRQRD